MSKKKIYKGLNKRRKFDFKKFVTIILCIALILGYTYKKVKAYQNGEDKTILNSIASICDKLYFWKQLDINSINLKFFNKDDSKEDDGKALSNKQSSDEKIKNDDNSKSSSNEVEVAMVNGMDVYLIQVGSFESESDVEDIQNKLDKNKMPNSVLEVDNFKKVQTYISTEEENLRLKLSSVKKIFSDAFLTKLEIPILSLEYTNDYTYVKNIADNLNDLLGSYKEEMTYYSQNSQKIDLNDYQKLLNDRKTILDKLNKELKKIDYSQLNVFKSSLLSYSSQIDNNIELSLQGIKQDNLNKCESLLISSIHGYYLFISQIKES